MQIINTKRKIIKFNKDIKNANEKTMRKQKGNNENICQSNDKMKKNDLEPAKIEKIGKKIGNNFYMF